ncbi:MAG: hypothetical protein WCK96_07800 [Methylococcales bacterium]
MDNVRFSIESDFYQNEIVFSMNENTSQIYKEDDYLCFSIKAPSSYGNPIISLQDFQIEVFRSGQSSFDIFEYKTNKAKHFVNLFGQSEIFLSFEHTDKILSFCVDILATKITAEQAKNLLDYLSKKMDSILKVCFSKTRYAISPVKGETQDISIMLTHAENGLKLLSRHKNKFKQKKITILKPRLEIQSQRQINNIINNSLLWIFNHLDKLYPVESGNVGFLHISGRNYDIDFIENETLYENSDIYENKLILSYLHEIKNFLHQIKIDLVAISENPRSNDGYFRFEDILSEIKESIFLNPRIKKCNILLKECNQLIAFINRYLPCSLVKGMRVKITPPVRANQHYKQLFLYVYEWQNFGEPNWQGENYLYGLRTLWKLYEFFCLYELIEGLNKVGFTLEYSESRQFFRESGFEGIKYKNENNPANFYSFKRDNLKIELYYEPNIWTYTKEYTKENDLIDVLHDGKGERSRFSPDFLLKVSDSDKHFLVVINSE